jgi:hypothetical protein
MSIRKGEVMVDNNPNSANNPKKWSNPLKKVLGDVKKFMKKEGGEDKKPSSFETSKNEINQESKQGSESSNIPKFETPETKEAERSARVRKAKVKEQKLPKKYRKGW